MFFNLTKLYADNPPQQKVEKPQEQLQYANPQDRPAPIPRNRDQFANYDVNQERAFQQQVNRYHENINQRNQVHLQQRTDDLYWFEACSNGNIQYVRQNVRQYAESIHPKTKWCGIHYAAFYQQIDVLQLLVPYEWAFQTTDDYMVREIGKKLLIPLRSCVITIFILTNQPELLEQFIELLNYDGHGADNLKLLFERGISIEIAHRTPNQAALMVLDLIEEGISSKPKFKEVVKNGTIIRGRQQFGNYTGFVSFTESKQYRIEDSSKKKILYQLKLPQNNVMKPTAYGRGGQFIHYFEPNNSLGILEACGHFNHVNLSTPHQLSGDGCIRGFFVDSNGLVSDGQVVRIGHISNGKLFGQGEVFTEQGKHIIGEFQDNLLHGFGVVQYKSKEIAGVYVRGNLFGFGVRNTEDSLNIGYFKNGLLQGHSWIQQYSKKSSCFVVGSFFEDKLNGWGIDAGSEGLYQSGQEFVSSVL